MTKIDRSVHLLCTNCEKETEGERIIKKGTFNVRGEPVTINVEYTDSVIWSAGLKLSLLSHHPPDSYFVLTKSDIGDILLVTRLPCVEGVLKSSERAAFAFYLAPRVLFTCAAADPPVAAACFWAYTRPHCPSVMESPDLPFPWYLKLIT